MSATIDTIESLCPDGLAEIYARDFKAESNGAPVLAGDGARFERVVCGNFCEGCLICEEDLEG